jgi:hypothetical protein
LTFGTIKLQAAQGELLLNGGGGISIFGPVAGDRRGITVDGQNAIRVFDVTGSGVRLDSLTITQGAPASGDGGGLLNVGNNTDLLHVGITRSTTSNHGGGISNRGSLTLDSCTISNNSGLAAAGIDNEFATLFVDDSRINDNSASGFAGGIFGPQQQHTDNAEHHREQCDRHRWWRRSFPPEWL